MKRTKADAGRIGGTTTAEEFKNPLKVEAGRKGGNSTLERYGRDQLIEWGNQGGRPPDKNHDDILRQRLSERQNNRHNREVITGAPGNMRQARKQVAERWRSTSIIAESEPAGTVEANPTQIVPARKEAVSR